MWIEQALDLAGTASVRRRWLPAERVVWLVIALALYRGQSMPEVLATLDLALPQATDLSFLRALHILQHETIWAAGMAPGRLPAHLNRLRKLLQFAIVEKRRGRQSPRQVKALPKRYTVRHLKKDLN